MKDNHVRHSQKIHNATGLYLAGIRDGHIAAALDKYTGARYTQHSTGVADGKEGFTAFFTPFLEHNPVRDIRVVRTIEDGQYVFCHVYQNLNNGRAQWVTADLFDTDEHDKVIEHWDVIQAYVAETASGRSMIDGPTDIQDLDKTAENKAIVQGFADNVLIGGTVDKASDYISTTQYHQHNPHIEDGLAGFTQHRQEATQSGMAARYIQVHRLIGQGNVVVMYSHVAMGSDEYACFDIFRLQDKKIIEHWDVQEKILAKEHWNNAGKF